MPHAKLVFKHYVLDIVIEAKLVYSMYKQNLAIQQAVYSAESKNTYIYILYIYI